MDDIESNHIFLGLDGLNIGAMLFQGIVFLLIILFFFSLILFARRILINQEMRSKNSMEINQKLDRIIELLEREKVD